MRITRAQAEAWGWDIGHLFDGATEGEAVAIKASKYRAVRTEYNGVKYASKAEAVRARSLDEDQKAGLVRWWIAQPTFRLGVPENVYRPDFLVVDRLGDIHAEDVKGVRTAKFNRDAKLWARYGPCPLHIRSRGKVVETIEPETAK